MTLNTKPQAAQPRRPFAAGPPERTLAPSRCAAVTGAAKVNDMPAA